MAEMKTDINITVNWTFTGPVTEEDFKEASRHIFGAVEAALTPWYVKLWRRIKAKVRGVFHGRRP